ncbi:PREDICTED: uncharacterized protein LOC108357156, partial [Rhagoletis zephyria]|uniref:uncharacterized protein LOC108357156 n=1 Tax=Rhagoletis zephyria TaxID=28612 RepID=UPI0008115F97
MQGILNDSLRRCLGLPPSSPIHVRYALAGELPPLRRAEWLAAKELGKQWLNNENIRAGLSVGGLGKCSYSFMYNKYRSLFDKIDYNTKFKKHKYFEVVGSSLCGSKRNYNSDQLKSMVLARFNDLKNEDFYLIATDASVTERVTGMAFYDPQRNSANLFKINDTFSSTYGELIAIWQAVLFLTANNVRKWAIITDSLASIRLLEKSRTSNFIVAAIHNRIASSACECARVMWVPSHVGIGLNEKADCYAKAAVGNGSFLRVKLTLGEVLCQIRKQIWSEWENEFTVLSTTKGRFFADNIDDIKKPPWFRDKKCDLNVYDIKLIN